MPNEPMTLTERLRNPEWVYAERRELQVKQTTKNMKGAADRLDAMHASLTEMVETYWGKAGDGGEPPACIVRAKQLLAERY